MKNTGITEEIERLKLLDKKHLINELIHTKVEISYLKAIDSNDELKNMNRTMFIGTDLYYSQEFVDDRISELNELKQCNSYYNQINTLSSKLARIRETVEESHEIFLSVGLKAKLLEIIDDKIIKIGSDKE